MSSQTREIPVVHNTARQRFEMVMDDEVAFVSYKHQAGRVVFEHTYVPERFRGKGIAAALLRAALNEACERRWRIVPQCSYVAAFIKRNPEFADLVTGK